MAPESDATGGGDTEYGMVGGRESSTGGFPRELALLTYLRVSDNIFGSSCLECQGDCVLSTLNISGKPHLTGNIAPELCCIDAFVFLQQDPV